MPIAGTIVLAYFNLQGFFVGGLMTGKTDPTSQAIYRLCLQVTAKFMVQGFQFIMLVELTHIRTGNIYCRVSY